MNRSLKLLASLLTLSAAGLLHGAPEAKLILPVISIQQVVTKDPTTYAMWIARNNEVIKGKLGVEKFFHVYLGQAAGEDAGAVFAVMAADSFATLTKSWQAVQDDPAAAESRSHLNAIRDLGHRTLLKAVRYDGANPGASLFNTLALLSDEAGYLKATDQLRLLLDTHDLKDAKINVYRVTAGRCTYSHLVSINLPSEERLAVFLDAMTTEPAFADWVAAAGKYRTVVRNGTYREITR